jgi:hypothetical protein
LPISEEDLWEFRALSRRKSSPPFDARDRAHILAMDADGKIVAVDIESDFDILGPMAEPSGIIKPLHLATS